MKMTNFDTFIQKTILDNATIEPNEKGISFSDLVLGDGSAAYGKQVVNYIKMSVNSKDSNKMTRSKFAQQDPETAQRIELLCEHLRILDQICNDLNAEHSQKKSKTPWSTLRTACSPKRRATPGRVSCTPATR
jgi:hypothetical protein